MKVAELFKNEYDPAFKMLDGTNPAKPYDIKTIMRAVMSLNEVKHHEGA